jgi:hypothetical protein
LFAIAGGNGYPGTNGNCAIMRGPQIYSQPVIGMLVVVFQQDRFATWFNVGDYDIQVSIIVKIDYPRPAA